MIEQPYLVRLGAPSNGDVIHRNDCVHARRHPNALRWLWADRTGFRNIDWEALRGGGLRPCGVCHPEALRVDDA